MDTQTGWSSLPEEIVIHILWFCDFFEVVRFRLLNKSHKHLIDAASKLQFLIELGRDGTAPTFVDSRTPIGILMDHHISSRKQWTALPLDSPILHPPSGSEFEIYEFGGGVITFCVPGEHHDTIRFQDYRNPVSELQSKRIVLAFKCFELSCDPLQDLVVVIQNHMPNYSVHILSISTGEYHTRANLKVFDNLINYPGVLYDVSTCISGNVIAFTCSASRSRSDFIAIVVVDWVLGKTLYSSTEFSSCHATLLSSRYMIMVHCGPSMQWPGPRLELYDLQSDPVAKRQTLLLPLLKSQSTYSFESSYFLHGSNNAIEADRGDGLIRTGDADVVALFIKARPSNGARTGRIIVMISRSRLIKLASSPVPMPQLLFSNWSRNGRYTRWLDIGEGRMRLLSHKGVYGSRCVCLANPQDLGVIWAVDGSSSNVCVLDFNLKSFMLGEPSRKMHIVRSIERIDSITKELEEDVRDGLEFGLTWSKVQSTGNWEDVYLDRDHLVARLY
ncbi:hypothetical protein FRC16_002073 [Serendipita sp. 398]|nr:hypothetical protein FRC16_002073 [Serendipita sp. 398]